MAIARGPTGTPRNCAAVVPTFDWASAPAGMDPAPMVIRRHHGRTRMFVVMMAVSLDDCNLARGVSDGGLNDIEVHAERNVEIFIRLQVPRHGAILDVPVLPERLNVVPARGEYL